MGFLAAAVAALAVSPGIAANSSLAVSVPLDVRSVTVSTTSVNATNCFDSYTEFQDLVIAEGTIPFGSDSGMVLPNGWCLTPPVTVTNGALAGHIYVAGTSAAPVSGTGTWNLVVSSAPGTDDFDLDTASFYSGVHGLSDQVYGTTPSPGCDTAFGPGSGGGPNCTAAAGAQSTEYVGIDGPSAQAAGDTAQAWTAQAIWVAVP